MFGKNIVEILKTHKIYKNVIFVSFFDWRKNLKLTFIDSWFSQKQKYYSRFLIYQKWNKIIELAYRVYVSRQTISNWENNTNYPDINGDVLLSEVFEISIDNLIKGDLEQMKKEIDLQQFKKWTSIH